MKIRYAVFLIIALLISGCREKLPTEVLIDGLSASMSDDQILQVLGLEAAKLSSKKEEGPDGHSIIYSDAGHGVWITRSVVSGVIVMRMKPDEQIKTWELVIPKAPNQAPEPIPPKWHRSS